jgi:archaellum component FlaG (FlaF/FlaG flagellin family)
MKKGMIILALLFLSISCTSNSEANAEERRNDFAAYIDNPTEMSFEDMEYDFGEVTEGKQVKYTFKFKNTGDQNLVLINVKGSCGCTVPEEWPKNPIAPGETGEIKVNFDSQGRVGNVRKNVRVEANTNPSLNILTLTGIVNE